MTDNNPLYDHSSLPDRTPLELPDGKSVALWFGVNIEHYVFGRPALSLAQFTAQLVPDPLNYGWRDYGPRVGIWRIMEILDDFGIRGTGILNADVCDHYPEIVDGGVQRNWAWVAHGANNSTWHVGFESAGEEGKFIDECAGRVAAATGSRPRGWLGPALTATLDTNNVLAQTGFDYVLDWANDDQPYDMNVEAGRLISVPYSSEVNDIPIFAIHHQTGEDFERALVDQFEVLRREGSQSARVMGVGIHPFLIGQPFRSKYLARALETICSSEDVWLTTSDEIAAWYMELQASG